MAHFPCQNFMYFLKGWKVLASMQNHFKIALQTFERFWPPYCNLVWCNPFLSQEAVEMAIWSIHDAL